MRKTCADCGTEFEAQREARKYCSGRCTKRAQRRPKADEAPVREAPATPVGTVAEATRVELERAGRVESAVGQSALALAVRIDAGNAETGSGLATMVREHRAALADALKEAKKAGDDLDELRAKRDCRRTG